MTKEQFEILRALLEKIVEGMNKENPYEYLNYWIPLISAFLGAIAVLVPQVIMWFVKTRREKFDKCRELIADAHRNSFLLIGYYKELVMHKVHKHYWFKASQFEENTKYHDLYYERHHDSSEDSFDTELRIKPLMADYIRTVKSFQILRGANDRIDSLIEEMNLFKPRKASCLDGIPHDELKEAANKEEEALNEEYGRYKEYFDKINRELEHALK